MTTLLKASLCFITLYLNQIGIEATIFQCNSSFTCGCSRYNANIDSRIVGGEIAPSHTWGWAVSLQNNVGRHFCGGTILSPNFILTAAHCVKDIINQPNMLKVAVGSDTITPAAQMLPISRIIAHPNYNERTKENDIAILRLQSPINFRDLNVAKVCFPLLATKEQPHYPIDNAPLVAIGWGYTVSGGPVSNVLRQVTLKAVNNKEEKCSNSIYNTRLQFCAAVNGGGKDTCQGDSGGPLMYYSPKEKVWVLAGITSYGRGCALSRYAGIYTRVAPYHNWIRSVVGESDMTNIPQNTANAVHVAKTIISTLVLLFLKNMLRF